MTAQPLVDQNREYAEEVFETILNGHDSEPISDYYTEDCEFYGMTGPEAIDREEYVEFLSVYLLAFHDLSFEIDELVTEGDTVAVRWTSTGTHEGDLMEPGD